jgi:serine/threonine protein kinase
MDGTISLGIWDSNDKLVRVLHRDAKIDNFTIDENSLKTTWDGKNDAAEDLPAGRYRARGYLVGKLKVDDLGKVASLPAGAADHLPVKLVTNPLTSDTRAVMEIGVAFDNNGSFLKTMDGLPLARLSETPNLTRVAINNSGEKAADVWQEDALGVEHLRISNVDRIMAFDCGFFELR